MLDGASTTSPPLIAFERVTIVRNGRAALDEVTLSIDAGEHVAIIGPNGSGKSTLIKTVARELYPVVRSGSAVRLLGRERWNVFELRSQLGIVSNDLMAATRTRPLTAEHVVISGFFSSIGIWPHHLVTDAMRDKAREILERLEVPHLKDRLLTELSSGEARRILIGRALVHDPATLLLDEPTNSLDFRAMQDLRDLCRRLAQRGTGILLVTHHLPDVIPEINRVILLKQGRVFRDGPKDEVLTSDVLRELFGSAVELVRRDGYYHLL
ncbi:MAG: ABC transporter ATP-binding protein [Vicinamibacteraceae bacterium]